MKKLILLIALALVSIDAMAQNPANITLSSTVTAYAADDRIGSALIVTPVNVFRETPEGYVMNLDATVDSVFTGSIEFFALFDTAGVMQYIANDNAKFVLTSGIKAKLIGSKTLSFTDGTTYSYAGDNWFHKYRLTSAKKIYWIPVARTAYTYKQSGKIEITPWIDEYR